MSHSLTFGEAEKKRWYILAIFCITYISQSNSWFTFSSIPDQVTDYYHLGARKSGKINPVIDLLLNWGPIMFLPVTPFAAYILSYPFKGLQYTVRIALTLIFFGNLIRSIPTILSYHFLPFCQNYQINDDFWNTLIFLHIGQMLNAAAGPFVMSPPTKLSVLWFPQHQRNTATAIGFVCGPFGVCIGYLMGPAIVQHSSQFGNLLLVELLMVLIPFICCMVYFPIAPNKLPTHASRRALIALPLKNENDISDSNTSDSNSNGDGGGSVSLGIENGVNNDKIINSALLPSVSRDKSLNAQIIVDTVNEMEVDSTFNQESTAMDARDILERDYNNYTEIYENDNEMLTDGKNASDFEIQRHLNNLKTISLCQHLKHFLSEMACLFTNFSAMMVVVGGGT